MIDWLTLKIDALQLPEAAIQIFRRRVGRVMKIDADGVVEWDIAARDSIRSDSHQVTVCLGSELCVTGSPARVCQSHNVFGSGDPVECARMMINFVATQIGHELPDVKQWRVTRLDITHNYDLQSAANVRQALMSLRMADGGRYQLRTTADTVYWSTNSKHRSAKAYHKGAHLEYACRKGIASVSEEELLLSDRLLRLELSLRSMFFSQQASCKWYELSESDLDGYHEAYFSKLIGGLEVSDMNSAQNSVCEAAKRLGLSEGQAKSAWLYWCAIQSQGFQYCRDHTSRSTHFRHVKVLREAGFSFADFQAQRVVSLRRAPLVLSQPVRSFDEMRRVA